MQDRYVGDIGDFANNGLLRHLCGKPELPSSDPDSPEGKLRLGVVWYRHPNEPSKGGLISYLSWTPENQETFQGCDPPLYFTLKDLVFHDNRTIEAFEERGILPVEGLYYRDYVPGNNQGNRQDREAARRMWLEGALDATRDAEVVFVNPDTGMASNEPPFTRKEPHQQGASKYVFVEDLRRFATPERGQSLVIYQHLGRLSIEGRVQHIQMLSESLAEELAPCQISALLFREGTARAYFIAAQPGRHQRIIQGRLRSFLASPWGNLFEWVV